jgi:hypothetical protein
MFSPLGRRASAGFGALFSIAYVAMSAVRLDAQGLYYDELHQGPAAFFWTGKHPVFIVSLEIAGIPALNMPYSGALKSNIYGIWLWLSGASFSASSWRLFGIGFAAIGTGWLVAAAARALPLIAAAVLGCLVVTDVSLVVMSRHDWGPVALSFLFRAVFIAAWIRAETQEQARRQDLFLMGAAAGLAIFEKLSGVVVLIPFALALATSARLWTRPNLLAALGGLAAGTLPLAVINAVTWVRSRQLISLSGLERRPRTLATLREQLSAYLSQAAGDRPLSAVLDLPTPPHVTQWQTAAICIAMAAVAIVGLRSRRPLARMAAVSAISWPAIGVAFWLTPKLTWVHHWIFGTPFQYMALALAFAAWFPARAGAPESREKPVALLRLVLAGCTAVLLATGMLGMVNVERAFAAGRYSVTFSPDLTTVAKAAAAEGPDAIFLAADWGVATQIYCMSNGRDDLVKELYGRYHGPQTLESLVGSPQIRSFYLAALNPPTAVAPEDVARIFADAATLPGWRVEPLQGKLAEVRNVSLTRYVRR